MSGRARLASLVVVALGCAACGDEVDRTRAVTPAGTVSDASIEIVVCNSNYQRQLSFTLAARADLTATTAAIDGLPLGDDAVMPVNVLIPEGHAYVVRCVDTLQLGGSSTESSGTARVGLTLVAAGKSHLASLDAPFSGGMQAFDNCGNVLAPDGCTLKDP